jgi:hypothetical protein
MQVKKKTKKHKLNTYVYATGSIALRLCWLWLCFMPVFPTYRARVVLEKPRVKPLLLLLKTMI